MARANRHRIPGCIWHITHRCHKKVFLLKFVHDRHRFVGWLREARPRFSVQILNYTGTSNHVHLLVKDNAEANSIPPSIQLADFDPKNRVIAPDNRYFGNDFV